MFRVERLDSGVPSENFAENRLPGLDLVVAVPVPNGLAQPQRAHKPLKTSGEPLFEAKVVPRANTQQGRRLRRALHLEGHYRRSG